MASHSDSSANNECLRSGQALADALVALVQPGVEADENQALARSDSGHTEPIFKKCNPTKTQTDFTRRKSHIEMFAAVPMFNDDQGESSRLDECDSTTVPTPSRYMSVDDIREEDEDEGDEVSSDENDSKNDTGTDTDMKQSSVRNQGTGRMLSHAHSTDSTESCVSETGSDGEGASRSLLTMQRARLNCSINSTAIDKIDAVPGDQVKDDQSGATYTNVGSESELNMSSTQRRLRSPSNPRPISPTDFTSRFYTPPHPGNSTALNPGSHAYTKPPHPHSRGARSVSVNSSSGAFRVHNSLNKGWAGKLMYRSGRKRGVSVGSACGDGATTLYPVASTVNSRRSSLSNSPGQSPKSRSRGHSISGGVGLLLQHLGAAMKGADGKRIPTKGKITGHTSDDSDGIKALSAKSSGGSLSSTSAMSAGSSTGTDASDDTEKMKLRPMPSDTTKKTLSHTFASIRRAGMRNSSSSATSSMATSGPGSLQNVKCIASDSLTINSDTARLGASFDSLDAICDSSDSVCMTPNLGYWEEIRASNEPRVWFDISEEEDEGEDGILSAASVNRLVEHYIRHFGSCSTFQVASYNFPKIMLRSHLWFLTSPGLLRKLTEIYDVPKDYPEEKRVRNAICQGLSRHFIAHLAPWCKVLGSICSFRA
ncbi:hypothetical protein, variant [Sphaeroforma arctica JP610]|uniref:N-terminal Ras-GEF domain-containing protein n=1 Tax=Sphaeroforma arctica JP610 TaxID=667725 RepID=A0A0L0FQG8_9EUKA|nr:hypothetical protein, variant [Sphaeroforma arctica JP610]KNC78796.1 hypothetical protein, variant [Sphaeroforma arctica JP610]|eukprot:XP_014152698.1 hypothetical protein, variant [Sphaeroforma arctica JP610]